MLTWLWRPLAAAVVWQRESGPSYLYLFDADVSDLSTVVLEDGNNCYAIEDLATYGLVFKRNGNAGNKVAFFNSYNLFDVPVKMTIKFYVLQTGTYARFAAGTSVVNGSNSGSRALWFQVTSWNSNAFRLNTNSGVLLDFGDIEAIRNITFNTSTLYIMEVRVRQSDNKSVMRISADGGATWSLESVHGAALAQQRLAILDGYDGGPATFGIKRVEVTAL